MKDSKLEESLRTAKPDIHPRRHFTAQVMESIETVSLSRRTRKLASIWQWVTTATAVFAAVAVVTLVANSEPSQPIVNPLSGQEQKIEQKITSNSNSDKPDTDSSKSQLAKQVQEDIDVINNEIGSIDSAEYSDAGLSEAVLHS